LKNESDEQERKNGRHSNESTFYFKPDQFAHKNVFELSKDTRTITQILRHYLQDEVQCEILYMNEGDSDKKSISFSVQVRPLSPEYKEPLNIQFPSEKEVRT
jgi:hypothetical protein